MKKSIYHYCSLETFSQIIKNKTIRLSDLNKTNDYMEKKWGKDLLYGVLCDELKRNGIDMNLKEDYWYSDNAHNHLEQLENEIKLFLKHQTLIVCFSKDPDMLSQWRAYGDDGKGVSVGFDVSMLKRALKGEKHLFIGDVIYRKDKQIDALRKGLFTPAFDYMRGMFEAEQVRCSDVYNEYFINEFDCFCEVLDRDAEKVFSFMKNPAFKEEKEVRIIYNTGIDDEMEDSYFLELACQEKMIGASKKMKLLPIQYAVRDDKLIAHADLSFEKMIKDGVITEITLGPKAKVSRDDVYKYLLVNGIYGVDVKESQASYR